MLYHPYGGRGQRSPDRVPPLDPHHVPYPNPQHQYLAPDQWNQINRARSDPAINQMSMHMMAGNGGPMMFPHQMQAGPSGLGQMMPLGPQCSMPNNMVPSQPTMVTQNQPMVGGPQHGNPQQGVQNANMQSPLQSPLHYPMSYGYPNGSPMQSPMGSPMGSSLILDERTTPMMELSPPGMHDPCSEAGSLPNLQHHGMTPHQQPPPYYHQTVGQRHSTGGALVGAPRLAPSTRTPESQSAPTSPANNLDPSQQLQWHGTRTFSNSPESLDIPRLVLTNPEGTNGPHLECFNDLQHITLDANDMEMLCNGTGNSIPVQQENQFHTE
nr:CBN-CRTC-1 protein [Haemonchus contortus]